MSPVRIFIGLVIAGLFLAGELVAFWYFDLPAKWLPIGLCAFAAIAGGLVGSTPMRNAMRTYWQRACTGICWKRRFPNAPKAEIREFLILFVEAFAFHRKRRCCFSPDDRVMDVYRALYPPGSWVDAMELECFCKMLKKRYGIDFAATWHENITLEEIYEQTRRHVA